MKKTVEMAAMLLMALFAFTGCSAIGDKTGSMYVIYGVTAVLSLILLIGYCCLIRKKDLWFMLLYLSVFIVNAGYFTLSISHNLAEALLANRISYFGSVFLPLSMLMIILNLTNLKYKKWIPVLLLGVSLSVFFVAASPGYLDIYYKSVSLETINGVTVLIKEYGEWHCIYLFYLIIYFALMIASIIHAAIKKKVECIMAVVIPAVAASVNIGVWLAEQLVRMDFEFLSVSYIISELFLLSLYLMIQENEKQPEISSSVPETTNNENLPVTEVKDHDITAAQPESSVSEAVSEPENHSSENDTDDYFSEQCSFFMENLRTLTFTERVIFNLYLDGRSTKEVMSSMNIKENTLKYHNKNIYSKLGVSSRKQLLHIANAAGVTQEKIK